MKKLLTVAMLAVMTCSICACGKTEVKDQKETTAKEENKKDDKADDKSSDAKEEKKDEVIGVSNEYYSMSIENVNWDDKNVTFDVVCENKDDKKATFNIARLDINGCIWSGGIYEDVEAGEKKTVQAEYRQDSNSIFESFDMYAFLQPDEIKVYPEVTSEDYDSEKALEEPFTFYPTGKSVNEVEYVDYTPKDDDIVIIDDPDILVCIVSVNPKSYTDIYYLYVENRTDKYLRCMLNSETYSENGENVEPVSGWVDLYGGERQNSIIYLKGEEVTSFAGTYEVYDYENDLFNENVLYHGDFDVNVADYDKD